MLTYPSFAQISLELINTRPNWSIHPFQDDKPSPALKQFFSETGILHPPIVQMAQEGRFNLVCGRKRIHALRHYFRQSSSPCLILPPELGPSSFFLYILTDQQLNAPLSPLETAFFLHYCLEKMNPEEIASVILPRLGCKQHPPIISQFISLLTLEEKIQHQIHYGLISDKIAFELMELPPEDRLSLSFLFEQLQPGTGKQKRFLSLIREIANRSRQSITSLLNEQEFKLILAHTEMNPPQKTHVLLELLQKKFYPESSETERAFQERVRRLNLPDTHAITHSLHFEKDEVYLTTTFPDLESCENDWDKRQIAENIIKTGRNPRNRTNR
jgi:hypothetical protein